MDLGRVGIWTVLDALDASVVRERAAELDELGYGAIWIPDAFGRDPLVAAALLLEATERLTVATGVVNVHGRDPHAMRAGWEALGEAFPGRFLLGLGVSHTPMVEDLRGHDYGRPLAVMRAHLDALDASLYLGRPAPERHRVLAALGPRMLALAAERAAGAHTYFTPPEHTPFAREALGPEPLLAVEQRVVLETDPTAARAAARAHMGTYLGLPNYTNNLRRFGYGDDDLADGGSDRLVDALVAWGDPEEIRARVEAHLDAGASHVCVQVLTNPPFGDPIAHWRALAPVLLD